VCDESMGNSKFTMNRNQQIFKECNLKMLQSISGDILSYNISSGQNINDSDILRYYKYIPNVNGLWYNTKIKYEQGFEY
jgi:hypothetical protein